MRVIAVSVLAFLAAFTGTSFAAQAAAPDGESLLEYVKPVLDAVVHGQWWPALALGVVLACALARKYMPDAYKHGVKGDIIGTALAFAMAFFGTLGSSVGAPGAVFTAAMLLTAGKVGFLAVGGYTVLHKIAGWLGESEWLAKRAPWVRGLLKMVTGMFGSDAIKKAEAAGDAAVVADPPTGMAGDDTVVEVE